MRFSRALAGLIVVAAAGGAAPKVYVAGEVGAAETKSAIEAATAEAKRQADLLGLPLEFAFEPVVEPASWGDATAVILLIDDPERISAVAEALSEAGIAVLNVGSSDDALRTRCRPNLLHVAPSEKMLDDAAAQWRRVRPDDRYVKASAWHPDFVKFAGRELNNRWREATGRAMTDRDWALWAAVRLLADSLANNPDASPSELLTYLREEMEFDGQKGVPMTFRETGQLAQPLLIGVGGRLAGEAPVRGVAAYEDLDTLGLQACAP